MTTLLDSLKKYTTVVADTGEIEAIAQYRPRDATTNPTLLYQAAQKREYQDLVAEAAHFATRQSGDQQQRMGAFLDKLAVNFGCEILKIIPGRVSTEVDAAHSFDTAATLERAQRLIKLYEAANVPRSRVLIKIGSTWEGIRAAEQLERDGIHCNLTLLFSFAQAVACADAGVTLVSPFVGRIYDWYCRDKGVKDIPREEDPGVSSVTRIYNYFKKFGYRTEIMGASFRKATQIMDLCGCDLLTISPQLLAELQGSTGDLQPRLSIEEAKRQSLERVPLDEKSYRWLHNEDPMAVEKLSDGIRRFYQDARKLEVYAQQFIS